jgi:diguanylate cyclase (GGDEF)-like protein
VQKLVGPLLERLTTFVFPFLLIGLAAVALTWQRGHSGVEESVPLSVAVWEQPDVVTEPPDSEVVLKALESQPQALSVETHRSIRPFWFLVSLPASVAGSSAVIDFPSRHAMDLACWNPSSGDSLGRANFSSVEGQLERSRAGFAWVVPDGYAAKSVLCRSSFRGPAKVFAQSWTREGLAKARVTHKKTGIVIEGAIGVLAVFMLLTALVNSSALYLAFVGGLLLNMRMAALSVGTDFHFLGSDIPPEFLTPMRQWTLCLYFANTVGLFTVLFKEELRGIRTRWPLSVHQGLAVLLIIAAPFATYESILPVLWVATFTVVAVMVGYLVVILRRTKSRVAAWYGASIMVTLISTLNEVVIAATGQRVLQSGLNSVTAAIGSALLASAAVAEHMRTHRLQNQRAQRLLEAAYQDSPIGLFSVGEGTHITKTNPAFQAMVQTMDVPEVSTLSDLFDVGVVRQISALHQALKGGNLELQTSVRGEDARATRWFSIRASTVDGRIIECSLQDITERVSATERLEFLASHDPLTGCLNLRGLGLKAGAAQQRPVALAYFDLDRFKLINDLYGHTAGDLVLKQVAERMRRVLQPGDLLARIGGDEFVVVFYQGNMPECEVKCNTITTLIGSAPFQIESQSFALDVSAGLVGTDQFKNSELKDIVSAADTLCRMAKKRSHQRMVVMQSGDRFFQQHQDELDLINCLERGETPEGLFLMMQPEVSLSRPFDSLNFEMLVRLRKADGTIVPAGTIIEAAEAHGKTAIIDRWVVNTAIRWLEAHTHALRNTHFVGVNLSGGSLNDEQFTEELFALFKQHPVALEKICIEITETVAITDMRNMQRFIDRVRSMGGKVALDDFGAGYSSFGYLKGLSVDSLKLDGSLVRDAVRSQAGQAIIVAIAGLVSSLGMKSVGEFAEDLPTIKVLYEAGIDYAQGYGISKPVEGERILAARSGADFIEDPEILDFFRLVQSGDSESMSLFQDSRRSPL